METARVPNRVLQEPGLNICDSKSLSGLERSDVSLLD
jgi:hypothetical protein